MQLYYITISQIERMQVPQAVIVKLDQLSEAISRNLVGCIHQQVVGLTKCIKIKVIEI